MLLTRTDDGFNGEIRGMDQAMEIAADKLSLIEMALHGFAIDEDRRPSSDELSVLHIKAIEAHSLLEYAIGIRDGERRTAEA